MINHLKILTVVMCCIGAFITYAQNTYDDPIYGSSSQSDNDAMNGDNRSAVLDSIKSIDSHHNDNANHIIYLEVPKKINIKDKIFLVNRSPYTVLQAAVVLIQDQQVTPLGNANVVVSGGECEMASFDNNWLKKLKGQVIGIKVKGIKKSIGDTSATGVAGGSFVTGGFAVGVRHTEIKADELNDLDPSLITYNFNARLSEENHDLYITITSGQDAFDF